MSKVHAELEDWDDDERFVIELALTREEAIKLVSLGGGPQPESFEDFLNQLEAAAMNAWANTGDRSQFRALAFALYSADIIRRDPRRTPGKITGTL